MSDDAADTPPPDNRPNIRTVSVVPTRLVGRTVRHPSVALEYVEPYGILLSVLIARAFGAPPPDLSLVPNHGVVLGDAAHPLATLMDWALSFFHEHGPKLPEGDSLRAFQYVWSGQRGEVRANMLTSGEICFSLLPPTRKDCLFSVEACLNLLPSEDRDYSHVTLFSGVVAGAPSWLVFSQLVPSMIRKQSARELTSLVSQAVPPAARGRWRKLLADLEDPEMVRTALFQASQAPGFEMGDTLGSLRRGLAGRVVEEIERNILAGMPSRHSKIDVQVTDPQSPELDVQHVPTENLEVQGAVDSLDARAREIVERYYLQDQTDGEIGTALNISQQRVNVIRKAALRALKDRLTP